VDNEKYIIKLIRKPERKRSLLRPRRRLGYGIKNIPESYRVGEFGRISISTAQGPVMVFGEGGYKSPSFRNKDKFFEQLVDYQHVKKGSME
jgi:hypothetical protein